MKRKKNPRSLRTFWQSFIITLTGILCVGGLLIVHYNTQRISIGAAVEESSFVPMPDRLNLSAIAQPPEAVSEPVIKMGALLPAPLRLLWEGTISTAKLFELLGRLLSPS